MLHPLNEDGLSLVVEEGEETIVADPQLVLIGSDGTSEEVMRVRGGQLDLCDPTGGDLPVEAVQIANRALRPSDGPGGQSPSRVFTRSWPTPRPPLRARRASRRPPRHPGGGAP